MVSPSGNTSGASLVMDEIPTESSAIKFTNKIDDLTKLRSSLREQVVSSPLFNSVRFSSNFEVALKNIWNIKVDREKN